MPRKPITIDELRVLDDSGYLTPLERRLIDALMDAQATLFDAQTAPKAMCLRLRQCAERHGLEIGRDYIDVVVIRKLDEAMAGKETAA